MSNAKRRKQRGRSAPAPRPAERAAPPVAKEARPVPGWLGWLSRPPGDSGFPSIWASVRAGAILVGSSVPILLTTFLFVFLAWVGLVSVGLEGPPGRLVNLAALPPIGTYFDALNGVTVFGYGTAGLAAAGVFLLVRAAFLAVVTGMVVVAFDGGGPLEGAIRGLRAYPVALAVNVLSLSLMVAGTIVLPLLGPGIGFLGSVLILVAALFLFAFAPAGAVTDRRPLAETLSRGVRAATMPGSRHAVMSLLYVFLALPLLVFLAPEGNVLTVNPALETWVYVLLVAFVHVTFLAAFAYRWMSVRETVPEPRAPARRR
jgi:hypothetical protein